MDFPPVKLMFLEQGESSLEKHLEGFLDLPHQTTFPDYCLQLSGEAFTVEVAASPTPHPVPSQDHPDGDDQRPEPTVGGWRPLRFMRATGDYIATEPEQRAPDQTRFPSWTPVSPSGLFGPAIEGFAERFTTAQKSSQAMRHFLSKRSSSAAASSCPRAVLTQQQSKPASTIGTMCLLQKLGPHMFTCPCSLSLL
ncbi:hypothetical protein DPX16_11848 [Anabarilius grahami]|uniref:Uncharacterized protein n=1 Tax=Anabarilius grahami TaxID=495550 RepID=A0A3N0Z8J1_ANAGA|nr:hypothetical protein DPX16_11848 [Anabarilius grahami]